jgi:hypothetical protein
MRARIEWLAAHVEPYFSYRYLLGLVFGAMFVHWLVTTILWMRDLGRPVPGATQRERALQRIGRAWILLLLLRALSWGTLRRHAGLALQLALLAAAAIGLNVLIFGAS